MRTWIAAVTTSALILGFAGSVLAQPRRADVEPASRPTAAQTMRLKPIELFGDLQRPSVHIVLPAASGRYAPAPLSRFEPALNALLSSVRRRPF